MYSVISGHSHDPGRGDQGMSIRGCRSFPSWGRFLAGRLHGNCWGIHRAGVWMDAL